MDLGRIARFTNITDESFTHNYHGQPFTVGAHEVMMFPYDLARHLAKHLARKIMVGGASSDRLKNDRALFGEEEENRLISTIVDGETRADVTPELSEVEILRKRITELNAKKPEGAPEAEGRTKADVMEEMVKLNLPVDKRLSMAKLEEQLAAAKKAVV